MAGQQKTLIFALILTVVSALGVSLVLRQNPKPFSRLARTGAEAPPKKDFLLENSGKGMTIESPAFPNGQNIPAKYTCDGNNISPALVVRGAPESAKSLVLIVDDPDAPAGRWVHWTLWDIKPETAEIPEGGVPAGAVQGLTDFGKVGYGGPCPPSGMHRYFFKLYALGTMLGLASQAKAQEIEEAMEGHIIEKAELVGLYSRR